MSISKFLTIMFLMSINKSCFGSQYVPYNEDIRIFITESDGRREVGPQYFNDPNTLIRTVELNERYVTIPSTFDPIIREKIINRELKVAWYRPTAMISRGYDPTDPVKYDITAAGDLKFRKIDLFDWGDYSCGIEFPNGTYHSQGATWRIKINIPKTFWVHNEEEDADIQRGYKLSYIEALFDVYLRTLADHYYNHDDRAIINKCKDTCQSVGNQLFEYKRNNVSYVTIFEDLLSPDNNENPKWFRIAINPLDKTHCHRISDYYPGHESLGRDLIYSLSDNLRISLFEDSNCDPDYLMANVTESRGVWDQHRQGRIRSIKVC